MKKSIIFSCCLLLAFAGCSVTVSEDPEPVETVNENGDADSDEIYQNAPEQIDVAKLVYLVNEARKVSRYCGEEYFYSAGAVIWDEKIVEASQIHSDDMNLNNFFDHQGSDGTNAGDRLHTVQYSWQTWGENIAKGYDTEEEVIEGWLDSPGHCVNIMNPDFIQMGIAVSGAYWTQVFAKPWK